MFNKNKKELKEANCVTHGGKFHSDEIFATVILSKILTNIKLIRVNEVTDSMRESIANKLVYDIGGGEFDHHQAGGNGQRDNGVKYASCGLIWKSYGKKYLEKCQGGLQAALFVFSEVSMFSCDKPW